MPERTQSPDGRYEVSFSHVEMRMSHWLDCPALLDTATGQALLDMGETLWSADCVEWAPDSRRAMLVLRRYPGDAPAVTVAIDLAARICEVRAPGGTASLALAELVRWLERWYEQHRGS
jgi:hypothetical protein